MIFSRSLVALKGQAYIYIWHIYIYIYVYTYILGVLTTNIDAQQHILPSLVPWNSILPLTIIASLDS